MKLYVIKCDEFRKIGITNNLEARISVMQTNNPHPLELEYEFELGSFAKEVETTLHKTLNYCKVQGEWYDLDNTALDYVLFTVLGCIPLERVSEETAMVWYKTKKAVESLAPLPSMLQMHIDFDCDLTKVVKKAQE